MLFARTTNYPSRGFWIGGLLAATVAVGLPSAGRAQTLDRVRSAAAVKLGYDPNARPFSFKDEGDNAAGYSITLCTQVANELKGELGRTDLVIEWIPLSEDAAYRAVQDQSIDLFCGAEPITLTRRKEVSFSIPIFPSGTGALLSVSAPLALREVLTYGQPSDRPIWRGSPARTLLEHKTFSPIAGTTSEGWLSERIKTFQLSATVTPVSTYDQGIESVLNGSSNVVFGDLPLLLDAAARSENSSNLIVLKRHFTYEPLGLVLARYDEDFRLVVDRALSGAYRSEDFRALFTEWFGPPDESVVTFFRQAALPE
ncbi:amino acid ABC transporter substrate-binding protein (plasmid) [Sinorhizobium sp. K101]|uniref:amino acid ABC transporter substrate-binding protein n=1 Tax=unclassified Sinorhizobium TaxID=2613772 RepID=UPI0023D814F2|nr:MULTISPECIES: amino acid ABC transporter substrate-binding protein [unclassified Sinorhizobium]WEJ12149.1 amino acid ABC transporter substrate-binding protein [Sinorhizobium sp. M103]WEJ17408.1 amino acid ABC transporter substrate-binding protein [Sinorhizobium sp. K101]